MSALAFVSPESSDKGAWPRLLAACLLSALLHAMLLGVPVNPTGGTPNVVSTIQARLAPAEAEEAAVSVTPAETVPARAEPHGEAGAEKIPPERPQPPAKPAAAAPSSPGSGIEVPLIRDPVYYAARQLDIYPQPAALIQPKCPDGAIAQRINGRVQLLLLIDEFGVVNEASIVEAQPEGVFDEITLQSFRAARFVPGQKQGRHVKSRVVLRVNFLCSDSEASAR